MQWSEHGFLVSMPNMVPDKLSEVELIKILGDVQWQTISKILQLPSTEICNDHGERLYASFINIDISFAKKTQMDFGEGAQICFRNASRFYSRRFVEGFFCLDNAAIPPSLSDKINERGDLELLDIPWVYLTNAFVTREESNLRLRTFAPAGAAHGEDFVTEATPPGIRDHLSVERTGNLTLSGMESAVPVTDSGRQEIVYDIVPESDMNGVGLLYFARYLAIANYGERLFLRRCSSVEMSSRLIRFLSTKRRRIFYFANATEDDSVNISVSAFASRGDKGSSASPTTTVPLKFYFTTELRRRSDGVLMAKSVVEKDLIIPKRLKSAAFEAERIERQLGFGSA